MHCNADLLQLIRILRPPPGEAQRAAHPFDQLDKVILRELDDHLIFLDHNARRGQIVRDASQYLLARLSHALSRLGARGHDPPYQTRLWRESPSNGFGAKIFHQLAR